MYKSRSLDDDLFSFFIRLFVFPTRTGRPAVKTPSTSPRKKPEGV